VSTINFSKGFLLTATNHGDIEGVPLMSRGIVGSSSNAFLYSASPPDVSGFDFLQAMTTRSRF